MTKIAGPGSASGSISQRHGSADPDPDPHQTVMDPEHWYKAIPLAGSVLTLPRQPCSLASFSTTAAPFSHSPRLTTFLHHHHTSN